MLWKRRLFDSALSRACLALSVGALFEGCIHFIIIFGLLITLICHPNFTATQARSKAGVFCSIFSMVKTFDCIKCGGHHVRPINRNCKNMDSDQSVDTNTQILKELKSLSGRMSQMEDKMETLSAISSSPSRTPSRGEISRESPASGRSPVSVSESRSAPSKGSVDSMDDDLVLPTLATLRQSRSIQDQVDTRIRELQAVDKEKGKYKSQRGGSETIWVKHEIAHNFVLSGNSKNRASYDSLSLSQ